MKTRIAYLDYIKVFLTIMVIIHHVAQSYGETGGAWLVFDKAKAPGLGHFLFFNASYLMALYFFISGYFMFISLSKKRFSEFLLDRLKRLGIPLLVISFGITIPLHYILSDKSQNYFSFIWDLYVNKPPLAVNHLWFVLSLFAYSLLIGWFVSRMGKNFKDNSKLKFFQPFFWIVIVTSINFIMRHTFPIDDWKTWLIPLVPAQLPNYFLAFVAGYLVCQNKFMKQISWKMAMFYFSLFIIAAFCRYNLADESNLYYLRIINENTLCVGVSLLIIKISQLIPNDNTRLLKVLSENTYGTYLVHLYIVIAIQYIFLSVDTTGWIKFFLVSIISTTLSFALSYLIRKIPKVSEVV